MNWYYEKNGSPEGPVEETQIEKLVKMGDISPTTRVWNETMPDWLPAAESTLAGLLRAVPPRLPPRLPPDLKPVPSASKPRRKFSIGKTAAAVFAIALVIAIVGNRAEQDESPRGTKSNGGNGRLSAYPGNDDLEQDAAAAVDSFVSALKKRKIEDALWWTSKWKDEWSNILSSGVGEVPQLEFVSSRRLASSLSPKGAAATYMVQTRDSETGEEIIWFVDHFWNNFDVGRENQFGVVPLGLYDNEVFPLHEKDNSSGGDRRENSSSGGYDDYPGNTAGERFAAKIAGMFLRELKNGNVEFILEAVGDTSRWVLEQAMQQSGVSANSPVLKQRLSRVPDLVLSSSELLESPPPGTRAGYLVGANNPKTGEHVLLMVHEQLDGSLVVFPSRELINFLSGNADSPF